MLSSNRSDFHRLLNLLRQLSANILSVRDSVVDASRVTVDALADNNKGTEKANQQQTSQLPRRITVDLQIPREETDRYYAERNKPGSLQWFTFWVGVVSLLVLIWYAYVTNRLWREASAANGLSKANAIASQRAYVHFSPSLSPLGSVDPINRQRVIAWFFQVPMENYGLTPTRRMHNHINWTVRETPIPASFGYPDMGDQTATNVLLAPRQLLTASKFSFDSVDLQRSGAGSAHAYVYGWLAYHDIFADTPEHITKFCYEIRFLSDPFSRTNLGSETNLCPYHNCADEDCNNEPAPSPPNGGQFVAAPRR